MSIVFIDVGSNPTPATKIKKMTSIENVFEQLEEQGLVFKSANNLLHISIDVSDYFDIKRLSKEMHKQEIIDAAERWKGTDFAERYYEETFGSKGINDKKINLVEIPQEQLEKERNPNYKYFNIDEPKLPQQETLYTEEQVVDAILMAREDNNPLFLWDYTPEEIIQSLKQPKKD